MGFLQRFYFFFLLAWGGVGVSDFFDKFAKNPNLIFFFWGGGGGGQTRGGLGN